MNLTIVRNIFRELRLLPPTPSYRKKFYYQAVINIINHLTNKPMGKISFVT